MIFRVLVSAQHLKEEENKGREANINGLDIQKPLLKTSAIHEHVADYSGGL